MIKELTAELSGGVRKMALTASPPPPPLLLWGPEDHKAAPFAASLPPTSLKYNERGGGGEMLEITEDMRKESLRCDDMDFLNNEVQLRIIPVHL